MLSTLLDNDTIASFQIKINLKTCYDKYGDNMKAKKTNAMRILDQKKVSYEMHEYSSDAIHVDGIHVADQINKPHGQVYKTIVLQNDNQHYVALIPVDEHIDLKKAAKGFKVKRLELLHVKELFDLTGYVRGGCSPIGMKKAFPTLIDDAALKLDTIIVSAGKIGQQIEINPADLESVTRATFSDITQKSAD